MAISKMDGNGDAGGYSRSGMHAANGEYSRQQARKQSTPKPLQKQKNCLSQASHHGMAAVKQTTTTTTTTA